MSDHILAVKTPDHETRRHQGRRRIGVHVDYSVIITVVLGLLLAVGVLLAMNWMEDRTSVEIPGTEHPNAGMPPMRGVP